MVLALVTFWYFFNFIKFVYGEMFASRLWKSLLFLTHSSWAFSWVFCMYFAVIWISFYPLLVTFITCWSLFWDSLLYCITYGGNQLFEFYRNSTDWLPHDAGSGCGESRNRLITVLYLFFFCLPDLYFYIAPSRVFFEYVSCRLFRWYLLILTGLLTCI